MRWDGMRQAERRHWTTRVRMRWRSSVAVASRRRGTGHVWRHVWRDGWRSGSRSIVRGRAGQRGSMREGVRGGSAMSIGAKFIARGPRPRAGRGGIRGIRWGRAATTARRRCAATPHGARPRAHRRLRGATGRVVCLSGPRPRCGLGRARSRRRRSARIISSGTQPAVRWRCGAASRRGAAALRRRGGLLLVVGLAPVNDGALSPSTSR